MKKLFSFVCFSFLLVGCKDSPVEPTPKPSEANQTIETQNLTTLDKALAVFDEPQIGDEEQFLRTLEIAQFLPALNKEQVLQVYEKIINHRFLNKDAMVLTIQRLTRIDATATKKLVSNIQGLEKGETDYLQALIIYTASENDLPSLVNYFKAYHDDFEDIRCSSFYGDGLRWEFWFSYYKQNPKRIDDYEELDEVYALAKIRRGEFSDLEQLSKFYDDTPSEPSMIEDLILDYGSFSDRKQATEWNKTKDFKAKKKHSKSMDRYRVNIFPENHENYDMLQDSESDFLSAAYNNPDSILLHLSKLIHLPSENYERILSITTEQDRLMIWRGLSNITSYYYSMQSPLAAYKAIYDHTYRQDSYMSTFPLLELVKKQPRTALKEYEKLSRWPLITPTGLFFPNARNLRFSFCYHLAKYAPELALKSGGKYLDYPEHQWGQSSNHESLSGIAYGLCTAGKEQELIEILLNAPDEWGEDERNFSSKTEDVLIGIAAYSIVKFQIYFLKLLAKYEYITPEESFIYLVDAEPASSIQYLKNLPENQESAYQIQEYLINFHQKNPMHATRLAEKHGLTIKLNPSD